MRSPTNRSAAAMLLLSLVLASSCDTSPARPQPISVATQATHPAPAPAPPAASTATQPPGPPLDGGSPAPVEPSTLPDSKLADGTRGKQPNADAFYPAASNLPVKLVGRIEQMGWTKSGESWDAGGSDYFVLVRAELPDTPGSGRRTILRPSPAFPTLKSFRPFVGQPVQVRGRHAGYIKFTPDPMSQYPTSDLDSDGQLSRGRGFLVDSITIIPADALAK